MMPNKRPVAFHLNHGGFLEDLSNATILLADLSNATILLADLSKVTILLDIFHF